MASELIRVPKEKIRPIRRKNAGQVISWLAQADKDLYINRLFIIEILSGFGIGPNGENIHKVKLSNGNDVHVDDDGLALIAPIEA